MRFAKREEDDDNGKCNKRQQRGGGWAFIGLNEGWVSSFLHEPAGQPQSASWFREVRHFALQR